MVYRDLASPVAFPHKCDPFFRDTSTALNPFPNIELPNQQVDLTAL